MEVHGVAVGDGIAGANAMVNTAAETQFGDVLITCGFNSPATPGTD